MPFEENLHTPSSLLIIQKLKLQYQGQFEPDNPNATFGYSVPVITDECPGILQYFPLNKNSLLALNEHLNEKRFLQKMEGKNRCVLICNSFDKIDSQTNIRTSLNPYGTFPAFIAGFWDATEDPLMAATLYSCTFLTKEPEENISNKSSDRVPFFLKTEEVESWLKEEFHFKG